MNHQKINRMVGIAVLAALVVVLQLLSSVIKIGTVSITLTLIPIVVGAASTARERARSSARCSALLSTSTPLPVRITAETWFSLPIRSSAPVVCIGKGTLSGWCAGLVYRLVARKDAALGRKRRRLLAASPRRS